MKPPNYRIVVLEPASRDVQEQYDYIRQRSPTGAESWYEAYLNALESLRSDPLGPSVAPEDEHVEEIIRQVFFRTRRGHPYRIVYTVIGDEVRVLRLRGFGQDLMGPEEFR